MERGPEPVAVAEINLSEEERARIAKDLGLEEDEISSVPEKLEIKRYAEEDIRRENLAAFAGMQLEFGKIPKGILITV